MNNDFIFNKAMSQVWKVKQYRYKNAARPDHGFLYLVSGSITYTFDAREVHLHAGEIVYLPKHSRYTVNFDLKDGAVEDYLVNFDTVSGASFTDTDTPTVVFSDQSGGLLYAFRDVVTAYNQTERSFLTLSRFYACLHALQAAVQDKDRDAARFAFEKAAERFAYEDGLSVTDLAEGLHMSRSAFQKKFVHCFGTTPVAYRTEKRLKKAKLLLETTDMPIKDIAASLGFYDTAYFYKVFKKAYKLTPKEYRKAEKPNI